MIQAYLRIVAPPGKRAEYLDVLLCLKGPTEVLEECRACWVVQDADNDHAFTYFVRWDCQENLAAHFRSERFRRLLPYIDMSVEFPEIDISGLDRLGGLDFLLGVLGVKQADLTKGEPHETRDVDGSNAGLGYGVGRRRGRRPPGRG